MPIIKEDIDRAVQALQSVIKSLTDPEDTVHRYVLRCALHMMKSRLFYAIIDICQQYVQTLEFSLDWSDSAQVALIGADSSTDQDFSFSSTPPGDPWCRTGFSSLDFPSTASSPNPHCRTPPFLRNLEDNVPSSATCRCSGNCRKHDAESRMPDQPEPKRQRIDHQSSFDNEWYCVADEDMASLDRQSEELRLVEVIKGVGGLGLKLVGSEHHGTFISEVTPGGVAWMDGRLLIGDQIVEVDNYDLGGRSHLAAADYILNLPVGTIVSLMVLYNPEEMDEYYKTLQYSPG
ncbi:disks large 1 tumor suppressor protein-like [Branchiostoma lanceolatum]|uniref:disks large 1 tumor suppressor protein-like n=1 Tax=Branchiostoma lanceolatum TaxID=7740 RepID=UPI0034549980